MKDLYLKFSSEQEFLSILNSMNLTFLNEENQEQVITSSHQYALDIVGEIPNKEGYHINLRIINLDFDVSLLEPYVIYPNTPSRVWA